MEKKSKFNSYLMIIGVLIMVFLIPYLWRRYRKDIDKHALYTIAQIAKQTGSLKNGRHWHYQFFYKNKLYENYRSTHVDYNVKLGDWFLVKFSSQNPSHNRILYDYKLKKYTPEVVYQVWDTIPNSMLVSGRR